VQFVSQIDSRSEADPRHGPLLDLLGMSAVSVEPGRVKVAYTVGPDHLRTRGIAHGGIIATLMDTTLGLAASTRAPEGLDVVTAQINVNFIRPAWQGERLEAFGEVQHSGRKTAVVTGKICTESGSLVATGSATLMYVPAPDLAKTDETR
jgi:acyl-CoA thioesterase